MKARISISRRATSASVGVWTRPSETAPSKAARSLIEAARVAFIPTTQSASERERAAAYIQAYFDRLPRVKAFIEATIEMGRRQGYVTTMFGRRRAIPEFMSTNFQTRSLGERLAVNSVIQGTAADIIKVAMIRCHRRLEREFPLARLVLQVHDELVFEVPEPVAKAVESAVVQEMVGAYPMDPPLGVDTGIGPDWLSAK